MISEAMPTLRSVALRPPYMHNASAANLDEVMRHYEKGGLDRPSRSPMMMPVQLSEQERRDLVTFMETLTGVPEGDAAPPPAPGATADTVATAIPPENASAVVVRARFTISATCADAAPHDAAPDPR